KRNLYVGSGQNIRFHARTGLLWPYVKERGHGLVPGVGLIAGLAALMCSLLFRQPIWFILWVAAVFAAIVAYALRNRSIYRTVPRLLRRMVVLQGTLKGFLLEPMAPDSYPAKVVVIK